MCTIVAKYLPNWGWVAVKNRDRNYKPTIYIRQDNKEGTEATFIVDSVTKYSEGVNEYGLGILNAATSVKNDESEVAAARRYAKDKKKKIGDYKAPDGIILRHALRYKTPKEAAEYLISKEFKGHTLIFNQEECYILEGGSNKEDFDKHTKLTAINPQHEWSGIRYDYKLKKISKDKTIVRTNHGQFLPWIGYQKNSDDIKELMSRTSSETRHATTIKNMEDVTTPDEMLEAISDCSNKDTQLNPVRRGDYQNRTKLKTTGQLCIIPKNKELIYIPIWCYSDSTNFDKVNSSKTETFFTLKGFKPYKEYGGKKPIKEGYLLFDGNIKDII